MVIITGVEGYEFLCLNRTTVQIRNFVFVQPNSKVKAEKCGTYMLTCFYINC